MRSALNHYAMGDIELPEEADAVQEVKKLGTRKIRAAKQKIEKRMTKSKIKRHGIGSSNEEDKNAELEDIITETPKDQYTFVHVMAATTISAMLRGVRTRMVLQKWKRMVKFAKVDPNIHPLTRTKHSLKERNIHLLSKGVRSIGQKTTLSRLASNARSRVEKKNSQY